MSCHVILSFFSWLRDLDMVQGTHYGTMNFFYFWRGSSCSKFIFWGGFLWFLLCKKENKLFEAQNSFFFPWGSLSFSLVHQIQSRGYIVSLIIDPSFNGPCCCEFFSSFLQVLFIKVSLLTYVYIIF